MTNKQGNAQDNPQTEAAQNKLKDIQGNAKETTQDTGDKAQELKGKAQEKAEDVGDKAQELKGKAQETAEDAKDKVQANVQTAKEKAPDVEEGIQAAKEKLPDVTPTPPGLKAESSAQDLKARLEGGEPGLTIIDVRDRETYNDGHIMGAIPMPMDELVERAKSSLQVNRDIYVYGGSDQETAQAANSLRQAGFMNVAELKGGLDGWKAIAGSTEGRAEAQAEPGPQAYNVISQVTDHMSKQ